MILNASAANGSSSDALRVAGRPSSSPFFGGSTPSTGGTSSGEGR